MIALPTLRSALLSREFRPTDIGGLQLWLDGSRGLWQDSARTTPATADGDPVGCWDDQSGNGRNVTQATAAARGAYRVAVANGRPGVGFDGVDDELGVLSALGVSGGADCNVTILLAVSLASANLAGSFIKIGGNGGTDGVAFGVGAGGIDTSGNEAVALYESVRHIVSGQLYGTGPHIGVLGVASGVPTFWRDGAFLATVAGGNPIAGMTANTRIGGYGMRYVAVRTLEVVVYNSALSDTDRRRVESYLSRRYAVAVS